MTLEDLHIIVIQGVDNLNAQISDALHAEEINLILQMMQNSFIRGFFKPNREMVSVESTILSQADLKNLIKFDIELEKVPAPIVSYVSFNAPDTLMYPIALTAQVDRSPQSEEKMPVRIVPHEDLEKTLQNPYATTHHLSPVGVVYTNTISVYTKKRFIVNKAFLTYLKKPTEIKGIDLSIVLNDFSDEVYEIIGRKAIEYILETYQSQRFQTNVLENQMNK